MNIANNQIISQKLGLSPMNDSVGFPTKKLPVQAILVQDESQTNAENDYDFARKNLYDIIEAGQEALTDMLEFAKQSQSASAYEVVGTLVNGLVTANQKLLNLSKQVKEIQKVDKTPEEAEKTTGNVTNNLFVGTTAELHKLLKGE